MSKYVFFVLQKNKIARTNGKYVMQCIMPNCAVAKQAKSHSNNSFCRCETRHVFYFRKLTY